MMTCFFACVNVAIQGLLAYRLANDQCRCAALEALRSLAASAVPRDHGDAFGTRAWMTEQRALVHAIVLRSQTSANFTARMSHVATIPFGNPSLATEAVVNFWNRQAHVLTGWTSPTVLCVLKN